MSSSIGPVAGGNLYAPGVGAGEEIVVKGEGIDPLYKYLTSVETKPTPAGPVSWNFEKFLVGKDGQVVGRFAPKTKPTDPKLVEAIETELKK